LWPENEDRWVQGLSWAFWSIFGEVDAAKERLDKVENWFLRYLAHSLLFMLSLISSTLLANLLIALMNNTYEEKKNASELEWAFNRVDTVLEFNEGADLPPPFNLLEFFWASPPNGAPAKAGKSRLMGNSAKYLRDAQGKALRLSKGGDDEEPGDKASEIRHRLSERSIQLQPDTKERHTTDSEAPPLELQKLQKEVIDVSRENRELLQENRELRQHQDELKQQVAKLERNLDAAKSREQRREEEVHRLQQKLNGSQAPPVPELTLQPSLCRQYETVTPLPPSPVAANSRKTS